MDLGIKGRTALVTGSHRGTGAEIARTLAREGVRVVVHGLVAGDGESVAAEIRDEGHWAQAMDADICTDDGADDLERQLTASKLSVDILVNNLGQAAGGTWESVTAGDFIDIYQKNTLSAVRMLRLLVPAMRARGWGRIVQLATIGTTRPGARMPHYYASKAALSNLTVSLAKELIGSGVTVNTVSPGLIRTAELSAYLEQRAVRKGWEGDADAIEARGAAELTGSAVRRMARVEEVAALVTFLVSEQAAYVHGANLRIDGGATDTVN
jgi:NAD(P)-dependent dehydrogenase (short-subunit alcohol dehydrogenase family)